MAQPFGVGDVLGGRYRVTHHVVTSADQDIIFQAVDEVLDREVSVLLASRANAKQVATSAKELATGERASEVQVLDLGLTAERTYLISSVVDPNQLLDLVVPDAAPYVEPYFTDSLGSELFGQSREMQPQTYHDDAEYYAQLQADLADSADPSRRLTSLARRRPTFLDKVTSQHADAESQRPQESPSEPASAAEEADDLHSAVDEAGEAHGIRPSQEIQRVFSLQADLDLVDADPQADADDEVLEAVYAWRPKDGSGPDSHRAPLLPVPSAPAEAQPAGLSDEQDDSQGPFYEAAPSAPISTLAVSTAGPARPTVQVDSAVAEGEEVVDDPPDEPDPNFDPGSGTARLREHSEGPMHPEGGTAEPSPPPADRSADQQPTSFTSLISAVPPRSRSSFPAPEGEAQPTAQSATSSGPGGRPAVMWAAAGVLAALVITAAVLLFLMFSAG